MSRPGGTITSRGRPAQRLKPALAADEARPWASLARVVVERKVPYMGLRYFGRWIDTGSFTLCFEDAPFEVLDEARLAAFEEDVLYRIRSE